MQKIFEIGYIHGFSISQPNLDEGHLGAWLLIYTWWDTIRQAQDKKLIEIWSKK